MDALPSCGAQNSTSLLETSSGHGIITFKCEVPGSEIIDLLGEGIVNAEIVRVASVLFDYTRAPEWIDSLEEVRVVRLSMSYQTFRGHCRQAGLARLAAGSWRA